MAMSIQTSVSARPAIGYPGTVDGAFPHEIITAWNGEATASIPMGAAVVWDPSTPSTDYSVTLPTSENDVVMGIVVRQDHYQRAWTDGDGVVHGELDSTGLRPDVALGVLRRGRILVTAATAVVPGASRLWVRAVAGLGETLGALEDADDSTDMIDCTGQGQWMTTAAAGELAWLEVDFVTEA